ncbi:hypothetical protein ACTXT7_001812 [Hymenolepis weldensis]
MPLWYPGSGVGPYNNALETRASGCAPHERSFSSPIPMPPTPNDSDMVISGLDAMHLSGDASLGLIAHRPSSMMASTLGFILHFAEIL